MNISGVQCETRISNGTVKQFKNKTITEIKGIALVSFFLKIIIHKMAQ